MEEMPLEKKTQHVHNTYLIAQIHIFFINSTSYIQNREELFWEYGTKKLKCRCNTVVTSRGKKYVWHLFFYWRTFSRIWGVGAL